MIVLFLIGIILPTGFLVSLGVHSIRTETTLLRRQAAERISEASASIQIRAQESIGALLKPYIDYTQNHSSLAAPDIAALKELKRQETASSLILLDPQDQVLFPYLEVPPAGRFALPDLPLAQAARLRAAERTEFQDRDFSVAAQEYETLLATVKNPRWKASLLTRMAGCLSKTSDRDRAEAAYQQILTDFDSELTENGDPYGLTTALQLAEFWQGAGQQAQAAALDLKTLQTLLAGHWSLAWRMEDFYGHHIADRLEKEKQILSGAQRRAADETLDHWRQRQAQVRDIGEFMRTRWVALHAQLASAHRLNVPTLLLSVKNSAVIYCPYVDPRNEERRFSLVAMLPTLPLVEKWQRDLQPLAAASQIDFRIGLPDGTPLASSPQPAAARWAWQRPLENVLPTLMLQMGERRDYPVERAVSQRQKVYLAMVALAAIVILVALYTVWYAVRREMEVAQLKAGFVASISHELKTPLSIISLVGQTLKLKRYQSDEEVEDYYGMLAEETDRLKGLIEEVLDFSRLLENRKPYHRRETDLVTLTQTTLDRCLRSVGPRDVHTTFQSSQTPFLASVDSDAMERVILNLLDNAIKYSPVERTSLAVSLRQDNGDAVLEVKDQGYGIPSDEIGLVFERFYRGRSATEHQKTNGVGLGLSLVRHIVQAHGGVVSVRSQKDVGSTFIVRFPLKEKP